MPLPVKSNHYKSQTREPPPSPSPPPLVSQLKAGYPAVALIQQCSPITVRVLGFAHPFPSIKQLTLFRSY